MRANNIIRIPILVSGLYEPYFMLIHTTLTEPKIILTNIQNNLFIYHHKYMKWGEALFKPFSLNKRLNMTRGKSKRISIDYEKIFGKPIASRPRSLDIKRLKKTKLIKIRAPAKILVGLRYKGMKKEIKKTKSR